MHVGKRVIAEFIGTFWLVFGGVGSAVISAAYPQLGIGFLGVALAFGLTVVTGGYALGHISGAHFNPAITAGRWAGRRILFRDVIPYIVFQVEGAIAAAVLKIVGEASLLSSRQLRVEWLWRLEPRPLQYCFRCYHRGGFDFFLRAGRVGIDLSGRAFRLCAAGNRFDPDPYPCRNSGHQWLFQFRPRHGPGDLCRQSLYRSACGSSGAHPLLAAWSRASWLGHIPEARFIDTYRKSGVGRRGCLNSRCGTNNVSRRAADIAVIFWPYLLPVDQREAQCRVLYAFWRSEGAATMRGPAAPPRRRGGREAR